MEENETKVDTWFGKFRQAESRFSAPFTFTRTTFLQDSWVVEENTLSCSSPARWNTPTEDKLLWVWLMCFVHVLILMSQIGKHKCIHLILIVKWNRSLIPILCDWKIPSTKFLSVTSPNWRVTASFLAPLRAFKASWVTGDGWLRPERMTEQPVSTSHVANWNRRKFEKFPYIYWCYTRKCHWNCNDWMKM